MGRLFSLHPFDHFKHGAARQEWDDPVDHEVQLLFVNRDKFTTRHSIISILCHRSGRFTAARHQLRAMQIGTISKGRFDIARGENCDRDPLWPQLMIQRFREAFYKCLGREVNGL